MTCHSHPGVVRIRNVAGTLTGTPITTRMWHNAAKAVGRAAKSHAAADADQAIAAAKVMFQNLHIEPNRNAEARQFLDDLERGRVQITRGQAETMRKLPAEVAIANTGPFPTPPTEVAETVTWINDDVDAIEFPDHSGLYEDDENDGWINPSYLMDPDAARNNCAPVTDAVHEHLVQQIGEPEGWQAKRVELVFPSGVHWANTLIGPDGREWVVDYSARQFDEFADVPLIAPRHQWQWWVTEKINTDFKEGLIEAVYR